MKQNGNSAQRAVRIVTMDIVVAVVIFAIGALVMYESRRLGASWGSDGPEAGYFPFYVGAILCVCGLAVFLQSLVKFKSDRQIFVTEEQFKLVLVVLVPTIAYAIGVWLIGIYVSSALFIVLFMRLAGHYTWLRSAAVCVMVSVTSFMMFEIWFKIPLPKGPIEALLGF